MSRLRIKQNPPVDDQSDEDLPPAVIVQVKTGPKELESLTRLLRGDDNDGPLGELLAGHPEIQGAPLFSVGPAIENRRLSWTLPTDRVIGSVDEGIFAPGLNVLHLPDSMNPEQTAATLNSDWRIEYAHVPAPRYPLSSNPRASEQWGLKICGFPSIWDDIDDDDIRIAVIDTGISPHEDLKIPIAYETFDKPLRDTENHGTAVAGVIAQVRDNYRGGAGAVNGSLYVYKVRDRSWYWQSYYNALRIVARAPVAVLNLSIGGTKADQTEVRLIHECILRGITVVAAVGNNGDSSGETVYPAAIVGVIAVAAYDRSGRRAAFSTRGRHVWIAAPGVEILATDASGPGRYSLRSGTSFAAPFVSGACGLIKRKFPGATPANVRDVLRHLAKELPGQNGWNDEVGHGALDVRGLPGIGSNSAGQPRWPGYRP